MKKSEIRVGGIYRARISGRFVDVRVDNIRERQGFKRAETVYDITNLTTKRTTTFRSAAKFRGPAIADLKRFIGWKWRDGEVECVEYKTSEAFAAKKAQLKSLSGPNDIVRVAGCKAVDQAAALAKFRKAWEDTDTVEPEDEQGSDPSAIPSVESTSDQTSENGKSAGPADGPSASGANAVPSPTSSIKPPAVNGDLTPTFGGLAATLKRAREAEKRDGLRPTEEQQAIIDSGPVRSRSGILVIEAGAGAGKTSTLKMLEETIPGRGQYTAFNKSLVEESKTKFKKATCSTTHGLAFQATGKKFAHRLGGRRVRASEVARRLGMSTLTITTGEHEKRLDAGFLASRMLLAIRKFCQSADRKIESQHFPYIDGLDMPGPDGKRGYANNEKVRNYLLPFAQAAWNDLTNPDGELPFEHGIYLKLFEMDNPVVSADYFLIDECQDLSPVMCSIVKQQKCLKILVGDSAQSIYGFTGAINAMAEFPDAPRLFLSQSFRFGPAIADVANSILESLQEPTELRLKGLPSIASRVEEIAEPVAILCRTNAAAVAAVLNAFAEGKRPHLIGGSADEVLAFVRAALDLQNGKTTAHPELACFSSWTEVQEYSKCFPAGTMVETSEGPTPIEKIADHQDHDWHVLSSLDGGKTLKYGRIVAAYKTLRKHPLVRIKHASGETVCTANHPFWIDGKGWTPAGLLVEGDSLLCLRQADDRQVGMLKTVRDKAVVEQEKGGRTQGQTELVVRGNTVPDLRETDPSKETDLLLVVREAVGQVERRSRCRAIKAAEDFQEDEGDTERLFGSVTGSPRQDIGDDEREGVKVDGLGRLWEGADEARSNAFPIIGSSPSQLALEPRLCRLQWKRVSYKRVADELQNRRSLPETSDSGRDRWQVACAPVSERKRRQKRSGTQKSRVVSVQVYEPRGGRQSDRGCTSDLRYVYTLSTTFGNYFADSTLTKNCDEGEDLRLMCKLIDAFGAKPIIEALNAMPAERDADLVVSTAHKSKGREWDTVRLAADFPTNSKSDDSDRRLLYVAATRAKIGLDVSQCPFFTGEDALEIVKTTPTADAVQPAATANGRPARTAPDGYSWAKDREHGWVVRGPKDAEVGEEVEVVRRNGSRSTERIIRAVREFPEANLYEVAG